MAANSAEIMNIREQLVKPLDELISAAKFIPSTVYDTSPPQLTREIHILEAQSKLSTKDNKIVKFKRVLKKISLESTKNKEKLKKSLRLTKQNNIPLKL